MILYQWRGARSNFGDALNGLLWPALLPGFFDADPGTRFLGIGSVLDRRHDDDAIKVVAGAGYGGYEPPIRLNPRWIIHWVRGPRTARLLGLDPALGLGDPASLVPMLYRRGGARPVVATGAVGFMPHFESMARGAWDRVAGAAGVTLIDPSDSPARVLAAIAGCRLLISEALHGVIVADALRVPWRAVRPLVVRHRAKWWDWADSLGVDPRFDVVSRSSALERVYAAGWDRYRPARPFLRWSEAWAPARGGGRLLARAAADLACLARGDGYLSDDAVLARALDRMRERIEALRRAPLGGVVTIPNSAQSPSCLLAADDFAHHPP